MSIQAIIIFLYLVAVLVIGHALHTGFSGQKNIDRENQAVASGYAADVLTIFDVPASGQAYSARVQGIYDHLATLRDTIGAERAYVFVYTSGNPREEPTTLNTVIEAVREGVLPQHHRLQGQEIPIWQIMEEVSYNTYTVLPYIYGTELYHTNGTIIGYFGVDCRENILLLQREQLNFTRQIIREIEAALMPSLSN